MTQALFGLGGVLSMAMAVVTIAGSAATSFQRGGRSSLDSWTLPQDFMARYCRHAAVTML
jgi:hypothetical protein